MKLYPFLLFLPLSLFGQTSVEPEFQTFYNQLLEYKDSIGHGEQFIYPLDLSELNCEDWSELWLVEEPARNIRRKTGKELCKEWKELLKQTDKKEALFSFDRAWSAQVVGGRYLIFTTQSLTSSGSQGKSWYFFAETDLPALSRLYLSLFDKRSAGDAFPFSDKLELQRDRQRKAYEDFRKMEELSMFSSFRLPLSKTDWSRWQLLYYKESGWEEVIGAYHSNYFRLYVPTEETIHYGKELYELFPVQMGGFQKDSQSRVQAFPGRNAPSNGKWQAWKVKEDVLMVRLYHSYPDGNQTSWFHEKVYYFVKK